MLKLTAALVFLSVALSPIYLFSSGLPQPADFIMVAAIVAASVFALATRGDMMIGSIPGSFGLLVIWVALVSLVWALVYSSEEFLWAPLFWLYNFFASAIVLLILTRLHNGRELLSWALIAALAVSTSGVFLDLRDPLGRTTGFFNNPNQLAYFSMCAVASLMVLNGFRVSSMPVVAGYTMGVIGLLSAVSLGALAGSAGLLLALVVANVKRLSSIIAMPIGAIIVIFAVAAVDTQFDGVFASGLESRLSRLDTKVDNIYVERNYQRILLFPEYNFLGAGSAHHEERFHPHGRNEIHSSFGALLFNFGIVGLTLFLLYLFHVLRGASLPILLTVSAPLLYSVTHMGLRFTPFWILLIIIFHHVQMTHAKGR
ncbi:MAG: hypothetical protein C0454_00930 [Parvibaculum sp.]|nr:hypothetical protein [Parvibaculum sp.]